MVAVVWVNGTVTVPHFTCSREWYGHECDTLAPKAGRLFFQRLRAALPFRVTADRGCRRRRQGKTCSTREYRWWPGAPQLFEAPIPRDECLVNPRSCRSRPDFRPPPGQVHEAECDMNRRRCRYHPWRNQVRQATVTFRQAAVAKPAIKQWWEFDIHSYPPEAGVYPVAGLQPWAARTDVPEMVLLDNSPQDAFDMFTVTWLQLLRHNGVHVHLLKGARNDINDEAYQMGAHFAFLIEFNEGLSDSRLRAIIDILVTTFVNLIQAGWGG